MIHLNISAEAVAWYGAVLATLTGIKSLHDWLRDRSWMKIEWQYDMSITGEGAKKFFLVRVINRGRRPVKITHVAVKLYGQKEVALLGHSFTNQETRVLTEENPATEYPTVQDGISKERLWYVIIYDAKGREYRKYNPESTPFVKRLYYRLTRPKTNKKVDRNRLARR